jgi:diguanylate cyclase (GGDEF)-like protein
VSILVRTATLLTLSLFHAAGLSGRTSSPSGEQPLMRGTALLAQTITPETLDQSARTSFLWFGIIVLALALGVTLWHGLRMRQANQKLTEARTAAEESRIRLETFLSHSPAIAFIKDEEGRIVHANAAFQTTLGRTPDVLPLTDGDRQVLETGQPAELVESVLNVDGDIRKWLTLRFPMQHPSGRPQIGVLAVDITDRAQAEQDLRFSEERFRIAVGSAADFVFELDRDTGAMRFFGDGWRRLGIDEIALPRNVSEWLNHVHPDDRERVRTSVDRAIEAGGPFAGEYRVATRRGMLHLSVRAAILESTPNTWVGIGTDITAQKLTEELLEHQALHDALTGLSNRRLLEDRLHHAIARAQRDSSMLALLFIDLDGFKVVNDSVGHAAGDEVLKEVAQRLQNTVRQADTLARTGGDEFMLLVESIKDESSAVLVADKVREALAAPFVTGGRTFGIGASIGISLFPVHGCDAATLQQHADSAMYQAKREGKNIARVYHSRVFTA